MTLTEKITELATRIASEINAIRNELSSAVGGRLPTSGGTMSGEIDMGFQKIVGLADPEWPQDAVNKQYVDAAVAGGGGGGGSFLPLTGGTLTGGLTIDDGLGFVWEVNPGVGTTTITDGSGGNFEAGVGIVSVVDGSTLGGAMMQGGSVSIYSDISEQLAAVPTQPYHAVTKQYIDTLVGNEAPDYVSEFEAALAL